MTLVCPRCAAHVTHLVEARPTPTDVVTIAAALFGVEPTAILGPSRSQSIARARTAAAAAIRAHLRLSGRELASYFARSDRTLAMRALRRHICDQHGRPILITDVPIDLKEARER